MLWRCLIGISAMILELFLEFLLGQLEAVCGLRAVLYLGKPFVAELVVE